MARFPPPLTREEEAELFLNFDAEARAELIVRNLRLVAYIANKYKSNAQDYEEFVSIGTVGLIKAVDSYDPNNKSKAKFPTYAVRCIQNEILMALRRAMKHSCCGSLQAPISVDKDGNEITVEDTLALKSYSINDEVENSVVIYEAMSTLTEKERQIINRRFGLNGRSELRQKEIAPIVGLSRSNLARVEKKALSKMREFLGGYNDSK